MNDFNSERVGHRKGHRPHATRLCVQISDVFSAVTLKALTEGLIAAGGTLVRTDVHAATSVACASALPHSARDSRSAAECGCTAFLC
jgi:hypothetical protein